MKKKINSKGFSLVELIVTVAIMAVLTVILTPTLLRNVEKSKLSRDKNTADVLYSAMLNAAGEPDINIPSTLTLVSSGGKITLPNSCDVNGDYWNKVKEYLGGKTLDFKSSIYGSSGSAVITATLDWTNRTVVVISSLPTDDKGYFALGE